jgi:hypothetical protein
VNDIVAVLPACPTRVVNDIVDAIEGGPDKVIIEKFNIKILQKHMGQLQDGEKLSDEV